MYCVTVTWKDYVGLEPFKYYAFTLDRANRIVAIQKRRVEALTVKVEEV